MLSCAPRKDAPLTHGHVLTIIAKALNINLENYTRKVECSYFTNHALVRGEVIDVALRFIPAHSRSCWRDLPGTTRVEEPIHQAMEEEEEEEDSKEELPQYQPFEDVPLLTYPLQSALGPSSDNPPIWDQILKNQISMQGQLNALERHQQQLNHRQRRMEYKLDKYFAQSGYSIDSPPTTPTDD